MWRKFPCRGDLEARKQARARAIASPLHLNNRLFLGVENVGEPRRNLPRKKVRRPLLRSQHYPGLRSLIGATSLHCWWYGRGVGPGFCRAFLLLRFTDTAIYYFPSSQLSASTFKSAISTLPSGSKSASAQSSSTLQLELSQYLASIE